MVLTVEPGVYFIDALLLPALEDPTKNKYLNAEKIKAFLNFGGVRLEDDVVVTDTGIDSILICFTILSLTTTDLTQCPREIEDVEFIMQNKTHPKFSFTFP
jgi:Xaa-Pro dipeptidase